MRRLLHTHIVALLCLASSTALHSPAMADTVSDNVSDTTAPVPAFLTAEKITHNEKNATVIASGRVEVNQHGHILMADEIVYNYHDDTLFARGNVSLLETTGDVMFAEEVTLKDSMQQAIITALRARLRDDSLLAANSAIKQNPTTYVLKQAVYSPCDVCNTVAGYSVPPLWQVKAQDITLREDEEIMEYRHAWIELMGVPTLYTPYLSHATPGAKRKSGFLVPTYGNSSSLGTLVKLPYYWNIAPNQDATITPVYTGNEGPLLMGEYRYLNDKGQMELHGSITHPDQRDSFGNTVPGKNQLRGHIEGYGQFSLENDWSWGFSSKRASDDTYLRRYHYGDETYLTTRFYTQQLHHSNYLRFETLSFQGMQVDDDPGKTPLILPLISTHHEATLDHNLGYYAIDSNVLVLSRDEGTESRRVSLTGEWTKPFISSGGHVFEIGSSLRVDGYSIHDNTQIDDDTPLKGRFIPQAHIGWSLPLMNQFTDYYVIVEPITQVIVSPYGNNSEVIPNEDSQFSEIADYNLFSGNRLTGLDRVEAGPRANYGVKGRIHNHTGQQLSFLTGQSYRPRTSASDPDIAGFDTHFSDFVGRVAFRANDLLTLAYRFRTDKETFRANRNEFESRIDWAPIALNLHYLSLNESTNSALGKREEILATSTVQLSDAWSLSGRSRHDLSRDGGTIYSGANILYSTSCIDIAFDWFREFTRDRDIEPSTSVTVQVSLKGLN